MNNFERITASPEALGDFLGTLPILSGPWDDDFHRVFCDSCDAENCDAENCAHQAERNSPTCCPQLAEPRRTTWFPDTSGMVRRNLLPLSR